MNNSLIEQLKRSARLPSPPGMALQILELCQSDDVSIGQLADTLAADPALSLRLLKYANSALVGAVKEVTSVRDAVMLLGIRTVRLMALSFSLITKDDPHACKEFDFERFWAHSLACAVCARHLASRTPHVAPEEAFAAGLLSHIGKLVFAVAMPAEYPAVLKAAGGTLGRTEQEEARVLGASHLSLGAQLMLEWGIPERLAEAVGLQEVDALPSQNARVQSLAELLILATDMADILCEAGSDQLLEKRRQRLAEAPIFNGAEAVEESLNVVREEFAELARILQVTEGCKRSVAEIQAEAGAVLTELSLAAQLQSEVARKENETLARKAMTDALTGIPNRAAFEERLAAVWKEVCARQAPIAIVLIDVDHFKRFNDTYGHQTGDEVLKAVARSLPRCARTVDFVARYGGEEFIAVLPNADRMTAAHIAVKFRKAVENCVVRVGSINHRVTVSVGAALLPRASAAITPEILIKIADKQLYVSKQKGRNCCTMVQLTPGAAAARPALSGA